MSDSDKALVEELRTALAEARQQLVAREEMMAVVAHDLRTPLNVITMYAQLLGREALPEKAANMAQRLHRTADGMGQLIKSLLDISQIESGSLVLSRQRVAPDALLRDAAQQNEAEAVRADVSLIVDCAPELPPLSVDYERIMRVFDNLVGNAIRFSRPAGQVCISAARSEGGVRFAVKDCGEGIAPDDLKGLLSRFWEVKLHERRGAGFGLAIASGLIAAHGGTMDAASMLGSGSEFGFTLPVVS